jgi:hypothetical protein
MKNNIEHLLIWFLLCVTLAAVVSATTQRDILIGDKITLADGKSLVLKDIADDKQETSWQVVDANNNKLQEFGLLSSLSDAFAYNPYFFKVGNVYSPGAWDFVPEGEVASLEISKIIPIQHVITITPDEAIACGTQFLVFSSYTHHIAPYNVILSQYSENTYHADYKGTYRRDTVHSVLIYANGSLGLLPGGNQVKYVTLDEINNVPYVFCGGGGVLVGGDTLGAVYYFKILNITPSFMTLEFFGCNNNKQCDAEFHENRTSCPKDCPLRCGDKICEYTEKIRDSFCCEDCGCTGELLCVNNACVEKEIAKEAPSDNNQGETQELESKSSGQDEKTHISFIQRIINWFKSLFG